MSTIEVSKVNVKIDDFLDSVDISHRYYNAGEKEIKYLTFSYVAYNAVNDIVERRNGKLTGPIAPKRYNTVDFSDMWRNPTVSTVNISEIHIQYMDNTEEVIEEEDIVFTEDPESAYYRASAIKQDREKRLQEIVYGNLDSDTNLAGIIELFEELEVDDELTVWSYATMVKDHLRRDDIKTRYLLGDYIEKKYLLSTDIRIAVLGLWQSAIETQQLYYKEDFAKECNGFPERYAEKIKKYKPAYNMPERNIPKYEMPKKSGCISWQ